MSLSIASAFRLRNKLKEKIRSLTAQTDNAEASKPIGTAENTDAFDGRTFSDTIAEIEHLMALLCAFNCAIEKANRVNKIDLIKLETAKAQLAFYENLVLKARTIAHFTYEYNPEGGRNRVELEPVIDLQALRKRLNELTKYKNALEEQLAESNIKTMVDFDAEQITARL